MVFVKFSCFYFYEFGKFNFFRLNSRINHSPLETLTMFEVIYFISSHLSPKLRPYLY